MQHTSITQHPLVRPYLSELWKDTAAGGGVGQQGTPAPCPLCLSCFSLALGSPLPLRRTKFVETLRERFADLDLTFSIGGQISFDVFPRV